MKTSELIGKSLNYAVMLCEFPENSVEFFFLMHTLRGSFAYSTEWAQGGPIIERESLWVREFAVACPATPDFISPDKKWFSYATRDHKGHAAAPYYGETYLISAMRCYVASKLGDEVDIPKELL